MDPELWDPQYKSPYMKKFSENRQKTDTPTEPQEEPNKKKEAEESKPMEKINPTTD